MFSPGGDTILLLGVSTLALVLARLTVPTPGLYQHLQDVFHLLPGAGSLAGPALVVPRVGLYHGGDDQGGAPLSSDLLEPGGMRGREGDIKTGGQVWSSPWLRLYKVVGEIPGQSDLISGLIPGPAPASRLTQHSDSPALPGNNNVSVSPHRSGSVWSPQSASGTREHPGWTRQARCESKNS